MLDKLTSDPSYEAQIFEEHLFSVRMKKILEEVCDRLIGDVAAHHYVTPDANLKNKNHLKKLNFLTPSHS